MKTEIISNGSRWAGQAPATIEELLNILTTEPLDPRFERYGNFINWLGSEQTGILDPQLRQQAKAENVFRFWGNFLNISHVFRIDTNDRSLIRHIARAIRANQKSAAYCAAKGGAK